MSDFITKRNGVYYFKKRAEGKVVFQSLKTSNRETAKAKAKLLAADLDAGRWDRVFELRVRKELAAVGEVLNLYRVSAAQLEITPRTAKNNADALEYVLRRASGAESVAGWSTSAVNAEVVRKFRAAVLREAAPDALERAKRSACSMLRQARSVFGPAALVLYKEFGLEFPSMDGFRKGALFEHVARVAYLPPDDGVVAATFAALPKLAAGSDLERAMYRAICLAVGAGLRKGEIAAAQWDWFAERDGRRVLRADMVTKNRTTLDVPILKEWWERLAAVRRPEERGADRVLGAASTQLVFREIGRWMGGLGWKTQKRIHEFRAYVGSRIAQEHGVMTASLFLRHGDVSTTERYYLRYLKLRDVEVKIG
jgi:integrase